MSHKLKATAILLILATGIHLYLSYTHYVIKYGTADQKSFCNISDTFNCDAVAASEYSSLFGIPISVFGAITNLSLLLILILLLMGIPEGKKRALRHSFVFSVFIALASLVYSSILFTQMSVICLYCLLLYLISFIVVGLLYLETRPQMKVLLSDWKFLKAGATGNSETLRKDNLKTLRYFLIFVFLIPILSIFLHHSLEKRFSQNQAKDIPQLVHHSIQEWLQNPKIEFDHAQASLSKGRPDAPITIVEFADFRCNHCKKASPTLSAFVGSQKDVQILFYNFPLDGSCNSHIPRSSTVSCRLAKSVHCASQQSRGWALHDTIFNNQSHFSRSFSTTDVDKKLKAIHQKVNLNWQELLTCMDSEKTHKAIQSQANMGGKAKVKGTPAIFMNGRHLPMGQMLPVLNQARKKALSLD